MTRKQTKKAAPKLRGAALASSQAAKPRAAVETPSRIAAAEVMPARGPSETAPRRQSARAARDPRSPHRTTDKKAQRTPSSRSSQRAGRDRAEPVNLDSSDESVDEEAEDEPEDEKDPSFQPAQEEVEDDDAPLPSAKHIRGLVVDSDEEKAETPPAPALDDRGEDPTASKVPEPPSSAVKPVSKETVPRGSPVDGQSNMDRRLCMMEDHIATMVASMKSVTQSVSIVHDLKRTVETLVTANPQSAVVKAHVTAEIKEEKPVSSPRPGVGKSRKKKNVRRSRTGHTKNSDEEGTVEARNKVNVDSDVEDADLTPVATYQRLMRPLVPHTQLAFCFDNLYPCFLRAVLIDILTLLETDNDEEGCLDMTPSRFVRFLETVTFSVKATDKKSVSGQGVGPDAVDLQYRVIAICLHRSQQNQFSQFHVPAKAKVKGDDVEEPARDGKTGESSKAPMPSQSAEAEKKIDAEGDLKSTVKQKVVQELPEIPFWLCDIPDGGKYTTVAYIEDALHIDTTSGAAGKLYEEKLNIASGEKDPERGDFALFAMMRAVRSLKKYLYFCRQAMPHGFFEPLGYVFCDWSMLPKMTTVQNNMELKWVTKPDENEALLLSTVPVMNTFDDDKCT